MIELIKANSTNELRAWKAIADKLDEIHGRLSQGHPFIRIKPKFKADVKTINKIAKFLRPDMPQISEITVGGTRTS